jgi:hypothetical protein
MHGLMHTVSFAHASYSMAQNLKTYTYLLKTNCLCLNSIQNGHVFGAEWFLNCFENRVGYKCNKYAHTSAYVRVFCTGIFEQSMGPVTE